MDSRKKLGLILASVGANLFLVGIYLIGQYDHVREKTYIVARNHSVITPRMLYVTEEAKKIGPIVSFEEGRIVTVRLSDSDFEKMSVQPELIVEPIVMYGKPKSWSWETFGCSRNPSPEPTPEPPQPAQTIDWGVMRSFGPEAQEFIKATSVRVCVLDTGIDKGHPDLMWLKGKNFTSPNEDDFQDRDGHGTHTAGLVGALNNSYGVQGASNAMLMIGKVLGDDGSGQNDWIARGIYWCADNGAHIVSMSLGGPYPSTVLQNALIYATGKGIKVFAAAGNEGSSSVGYPAGFRIQGLYSIGATGKNDELAYFSNFGKIEYVCPGVDILSTIPGGTYGLMSGTSMATPICAGVAALYHAQGRALRAEFKGDEYHFGGGLLSAQSLILDGF